MTDYRAKIAEFLETELGLPAGAYADNESLFSSGRLDSFGLLTLACFLEELLGRKLRTTEMTLVNLDSMERLISFMRVSPPKL